MKVQELQPQLQRNGLSPLYVVVGEEAYFRDLALSLLRQALGRAGSQDTEPADSEGTPSLMMNCDVVYGDETDASEILCMA
ncbi:MAG: hypothetical protein KC545_09350, partial [Nitrospira sp.]|nr:hypothetical protein [Nitrospira sp.]